MSRLARSTLALCSRAYRQWAQISLVRCQPHYRSTSTLWLHGPSRGVLHAHVSRVRRYGSLSTEDVKKKVEELTDQFLDARELLDDARSSQNTVYFVDDMKEAQSAVEETLKGYRDLLDTLTAEQRETVVRSIGLKMEELKAQEQMIEESLAE